MCVEFPRISLLQRVQWNCVYSLKILIENIVPVDVASLLEVNHVNLLCCALYCVNAFCYHLSAIIYMNISDSE